MRLEPRFQILGNRNQPRGSGFGFGSRHGNEASLHIDLAPVQADYLRRPQPSERADGHEGNHLTPYLCQYAAEFLGRVDCDFGPGLLPELHYRDRLGGNEFLPQSPRGEGLDRLQV